MKRCVFLLITLSCLLLISACGKESAAPGVSSSVSPAVASPPPSESKGPKIVFHSIIDDPQKDYMNTLGGGVSETSGTACLDLVLYETKPNVYEGCGIITRSIKISQGEAGGSVQKYVYRTGLIHAESGKGGYVTLSGWLIDDSTIPAMATDAPFNVMIHKDASLRQEGLPILLALSGNKASLSIKLHEHAEFVFKGELSSESAKSPVGIKSDPKSPIYVNSMWSSSFSGGAKGEVYTAILLASPKGNTYSGQISVQGTGSVLNPVNESVSFSLEPFDSSKYQKAGGKLDDKYASMSVLHLSSGNFILLLDGDKAILEAVGKGLYFFGNLPPESEYGTLKNEAEKTGKMLSYLYRQKSGTEASLPDFSGLKDLDPKKPEDLQKLKEASEKMNSVISHQAKPLWYPDNLIPLVNFYEDDGYATTPSASELLFRIYNTEYSELEDFEDLVQPYRSVLSGYDNYKEYLNYDDSEGVFLFTMGQYTVQVFLSQSVLKLTGVSVQIF